MNFAAVTLIGLIRPISPIISPIRPIGLIGPLTKWFRLQEAASKISLKVARHRAHQNNPELRLIDVARASLEELLEDYKDFLRQNNLKQWQKDDKRSLAIRQLAYKTNRSYRTYMSYMSDAESAANCLICLLSQTAYLLDNQLRVLAKEISQKGDLKDRLKAVSRARFFINPIDADYDNILKRNGMRRLADGRVVEL